MPDLVMMGEPRSGKLDGQLRNVGLLLVDSVVDPARPFTWLLDFGGGLGPFTTRHPGEAVVAAPPPPAPSPSPAPTPIADTAAAESSAVAAPVLAPAIPQSSVPVSTIPFDLAAEDEESVLEQTLDRTSWPRFGLLAALLLLALVAFFAKQPALRWGTLVATVALLGFGGVGFLSVSHITSAIDVGPGVFLEDLPLLLFVGFTVFTTLLWGRVFCGYLCPFGALQDLLERVVPRRFKRELPRRLHEHALWVKYGVLALVVVLAAIGSEVTLFQYVEPFGTVFFLSSSVVLWAIALGLLAASAVIPRFYCRYVCPLGASLAVASVLSPFRIRRVEQCTVCKVCEQDCPTGAIAGPSIDFKECVRCNVCEVNLRREVGTCRHDMADVRARLVQIGPCTRPELAGGD
ncbi:MAG: 4Fe-4S binding protein, partial [Longimicrobiales bacterium]